MDPEYCRIKSTHRDLTREKLGSCVAAKRAAKLGPRSPKLNLPCTIERQPNLVNLMESNSTNGRCARPAERKNTPRLCDEATAPDLRMYLTATFMHDSSRYRQHYIVLLSNKSLSRGQIGLMGVFR